MTTFICFVSCCEPAHSKIGRLLFAFHSLRALCWITDDFVCFVRCRERPLLNYKDDLCLRWQLLRAPSVKWMTTFVYIVSCCERALPMRHREIHILNLPWTISLIFQFAKSLLSEKIRNRIQIYSGTRPCALHVTFNSLLSTKGVWFINFANCSVLSNSLHEVSIELRVSTER